MEIRKISENIWQIEKEGEMNVPCVIFASEILLENMKKDKTLEQIKNVAKLPGILKYAVALPDAHQGYGFPIGGVAAFDLEKGVISPGGVGYDINCSVRLLKTNISKEDFMKKRDFLLNVAFDEIPSGVGEEGNFKISKKELDKVLEKGAKWCLERGFAEKEDIEKTEDSGCIPGGNPRDVSERAKSRGINQLATLGAGNHFLEFQEVEEVFDENIAKVFGIEKNKIFIMIHCGSRGLGHQVASDYIREMEKKYGWPKYDRELVYAPINSELGKKYFSAMACAANFAFANKQLITHKIRVAFKKHFPNLKIDVVYDVCHNIAKFEEHNIDGQLKKVLVTRKGATRSFGPGRKEIPEVYRDVGQPIILPGSMGTASYVLVGTKKAEELSFGSTAHGAGRTLSRLSATKNLSVKDIEKILSDKDIKLKTLSKKAILDEAPQAYKNVDEVARVSNEVGIGNFVVKLKPLGVIKS